MASWPEPERFDSECLSPLECLSLFFESFLVPNEWAFLPPLPPFFPSAFFLRASRLWSPASRAAQ